MLSLIIICINDGRLVAMVAYLHSQKQCKTIIETLGLNFGRFTVTYIQKQYLICYRQTSDLIKLYLLVQAI